MAKLLVLLDASDAATVDVGQAIHEGARTVRFAESDLMRLPGEVGTARGARIRELTDTGVITSYDAIALGMGPASGDRFAALLEELAPRGMHGALANKLGSVFPAPDPATTGEAHPGWPLLAPMARYGMILVPPGYAGPTGEPESLDAAARRLGKRLIDIAGWITHARSHHHH